jgi:hypothetical protein
MFGLVEFECRILTRKWVLWFSNCLKSLCGWWPKLSSVVQNIIAFCCWANADQNRRNVDIAFNIPRIKKVYKTDPRYFSILMPVCFLNFFDWSHVYQDIAVPSYCHNSFSWVKIRLYTKNQLPRSSGSALKVWVVGGWWVGVESDFSDRL